MSRQRQSGFTVVELSVVCAMIAILTAMAIPVAKYSIKRQNEMELKYDLRLLRDALDKYKQYADTGQIQVQLGSEGYPPDLKTLVDGVQLAGQLNKKQKFLRRIPIDPMTKKDEWGQRSYQDEPDSTSWGGQNVYDVFSLSDARATDGTYYKDW
ncbi:MAG TPA: type II secretion system protein [Thermoanaerobaculia bacterium]|jgi:general secretion pathway protein G